MSNVLILYSLMVSYYKRAHIYFKKIDTTHYSNIKYMCIVYSGVMM